MVRKNPPNYLHGYPCSYVAARCAADALGVNNPPFAGSLRDDGYLNLEEANRYFRKYLPVKKRAYFRQGERSRLKDFVLFGRAILLVKGHYLYADGCVYQSFFDNNEDEVISVWYLEK
jgi:hypothetical protein